MIMEAIHLPLMITLFLLVTTKFGRADATLTLLDTKYNTIWQTEEMENYIAAALLDGNILVISAKGVKERNRFTLKPLQQLC